MARRTSPALREYRKQRNRINALIRNYRKQGFEVDFSLPPVPKRITQASVRRLEKIKPETVRKKTRGVDYETGEIISYTRAKANQRRIRAQAKSQRIALSTGSLKLTDIFPEAPRASDIIIDNFRSNMSVWNEAAQSIIYQWLDSMIQQFGPDAVAQMLEKAEEEGMLPNNKIVYDALLLRNGLAQMVSLMDISQYQKDKLADAIEYEESFEDY